MALRLHTVVSSPRASSGIRSEKSSCSPRNEVISVIAWGNYSAGGKRTNSRQGDNRSRVLAIDHKSGGTSGSDSSQKGGSVPNTNYLVPLDKSPSSSCITRPLAEIFRDLNKRIPDNTLKPQSRIIPWYHANRMLSFYAPGWCGEVRDVIFSDNGSVTVIYRVTIRGSDGEAFRESTGTISSGEKGTLDDPVAAAEEIAFVRACSRFGLGLYLYHEE